MKGKTPYWFYEQVKILLLLIIEVEAELLCVKWIWFSNENSCKRKFYLKILDFMFIVKIASQGPGACPTWRVFVRVMNWINISV